MCFGKNGPARNIMIGAINGIFGGGGANGVRNSVPAPKPPAPAGTAVTEDERRIRAAAGDLRPTSLGNAYMQQQGQPRVTLLGKAG